MSDDCAAASTDIMHEKIAEVVVKLDEDETKVAQQETAAKKLEAEHKEHD
jgi:hypothetical protein